MYESHFGLRHRPFRNTPDSGFYYPATSHENALKTLLRAVEDDESLAVLTGEAGSGKTLICHRLLERLGPEVQTAFLTNSHLPGCAGLLQAILYDLSLPFEGMAEQELRLSLTDSLVTRYAAGGATLLLIDEAQHLRPECLEELRLLGNLEGRFGKAVQVILVGDPSLLERLKGAMLTALCQRLTVRIRLERLSVHEAADYLLHQLRAAGGRPADMLSDEALDVLARGTRGLPRLLNQAAHLAFSLASEAGEPLVDAEAAVDALAALGLADDAEAAEDGATPTVLGGNDSEIGDEGPAAGPDEAPPGPEGYNDRPRRLFPPDRRPA
jgi:type II secretory pathway predicted ATPase ExeA